MRWSDAEDDTDSDATSVDVMVVCGPAARGEGLLGELVGWGPSARTVTIKGRPGRRETWPTGEHAAWLVRPGVAVDVQVSDKVDIDEIIAGIRVTG